MTGTSTELTDVVAAAADALDWGAPSITVSIYLKLAAATPHSPVQLQAIAHALQDYPANTSAVSEPANL